MINKLGFRPDIVGLRAFSVIIILIYHFFPSYLKAGFIGVDIFFVISGFLITQILFIKSQKSSLFGFWKSRFLRLTPALCIVLLASIIAGWFFLLRDEYIALSEAILASLAAQSNLYEMLRSGYFENTQSLKPFLHLWSLAVEIQFYIFVSILIFWQRNNKKFLWVLAFLIVLSFIFNLKFIDSYSSSVFYLSPFRVWEFLIGSFIAIYQLDKKIPAYFSYLGFLLILIALFMINQQSKFPGFLALLPVLGTSFILLVNQRNKVSTFLSLKFLVLIGSISYSLYLWHWPILDFSKLILGDLTPFFRIGLILFSFILAYLTTFYIEKPLRDKKNIIGLIFFFVIILLCAFLIHLFDGIPSRSANLRNQALQTNENLLMDYRNNCLPFISNINKEDRCQTHYYKKNQTSLSVIGDSQANAFTTVLDALKDNNNYIQFGRGMCPSLLEYGPQQCQNFANEIYAYISHENNLQKVIIAAQWPLYAEGISLEGKKFTKEIFWESLEKTILAYKNLNKNIYILYVVPLGAQPRRCFNRFFGLPNECDLSFKEEEVSFNKYKLNLDKLINKYNLKVIDLHDVLCEGQICKVKVDNQLLYLDSSHLSRAGGAYIANKLNANLKKDLFN